MIKVTGKYIYGIISPVLDDNALAGIECPGIHSANCGEFSAALDNAREKLGLGSSATRDEIKSAYKMKASAVHPDKNPEMPGIEKEFDETNKAYKILMDYCAASDMASKNTKYSFLEKDINDNSILVKLRDQL